jgi:hypothetical protein
MLDKAQVVENLKRKSVNLRFIPSNEPFLAKGVLRYFSVKEKDPSKSLKIFIVVKNISVNQKRHFTLVIGNHDVFFYKCTKNYFIS